MRHQKKVSMHYATDAHLALKGTSSTYLSFPFLSPRGVKRRRYEHGMGLKSSRKGIRFWSLVQKTIYTICIVVKEMVLHDGTSCFTISHKVYYKRQEYA